MICGCGCGCMNFHSLLKCQPEIINASVVTKHLPSRRSPAPTYLPSEPHTTEYLHCSWKSRLPHWRSSPGQDCVHDGDGNVQRDNSKHPRIHHHPKSLLWRSLRFATAIHSFWHHSSRCSRYSADGIGLASAPRPCKEIPSGPRRMYPTGNFIHWSRKAKLGSGPPIKPWEGCVDHY